MPSTILAPSQAAAEFYERRSDRTRRCLDGRLPAPCHIEVSVSPQWAESPASRALLETLGNLLARFCARITIVVPLDQKTQLDASRLLAIMQQADPFGDFRTSLEPVFSDLTIGIGGLSGSVASGHHIVVGYCGWRAFVSGHDTVCPFSTPDGSFHALGAEMAACLAGAAAFRFWVEHSTRGIAPFQIDLLSLAAGANAPAFIEFCATAELRILMVGAGSVGSAVAYFLPRGGFRGHLDVVDHDLAEVENLDRSPVFTLADVGRPKVASIENHLHRHGISARGYPIKWSEFVTQYPSLLRSHDAWLPLANEHGVRRSMQSNYPPISFQASTGRNWGVQFGRHIPFIDDCQLDRFPEEPAVPLVCANGAVPVVAGKQVDAALPFASFMAGLLVAAAVIRLAHGYVRLGPNLALLSFTPNFDLLAYDRRPATNCTCRQTLPAVWEKRWRKPALC
jgi:hypothetical protein